mgnify:CR=1 FL=1
MNREGHNSVEYFIGPEVEHTPAYSKRTLFVVGKQDVSQIERMAREYKTPHIFMGANHSFGYENPGDNTYWDNTITSLLDKGFWVTLDYQAHLHEAVLKMLNPGIWQSRLFVPLLGVRIPKVQTSSPNLTIKIDDIDFNATNEGVWCIHHHEITDANRFTPWQDYATDAVLEPMAGAVPNPVLTIPVPKPVPVIEPVKAEEVAEPVVKNDASIGLDAASPSQLKPETAEDAAPTLVVNTVADAAEAYAEGTKEDPLGPKGAVKPAKAKK